MKFRIKQIDDNLFIPQVKHNYFSSWYGICDNSNIWISEMNQIDNCVFDKYEKANNIICIYKIKRYNKKIYPKYHKL
jgi:hypothetical protein